MGKDRAKLVMNINDNYQHGNLYNYTMNLLRQQKGFQSRTIIILCIGSDRYIGDALGPLVGSYLREKINSIVYGTLDSPVHGGNLVQVMEKIVEEYHQPIIIAVDACLGYSHEIGNIEIWEGGIEAGIAVGNPLPCVGHISIIGVVNASRHIGYADLQNTPLSIVMKLSKCIGEVLGAVVTGVHNHKVSM